MGAHYCNLWKFSLVDIRFCCSSSHIAQHVFLGAEQNIRRKIERSLGILLDEFRHQRHDKPYDPVCLVVCWWYCPGRIGLRRKTSDWMGLQTQLRYLSGNRNAQIHPTRARRPREDEIIDDIINDVFMDDAEFINDSHLVVVDVPIDQPENQFAEDAV